MVQTYILLFVFKFFKSERFPPENYVILLIILWFLLPKSCKNSVTYLLPNLRPIVVTVFIIWSFRIMLNSPFENLWVLENQSTSHGKEVWNSCNPRSEWETDAYIPDQTSHLMCPWETEEMAPMRPEAASEYVGGGCSPLTPLRYPKVLPSP